MDAIRKSEELLAATIRSEEETVCRMIENAHQEEYIHTPIMMKIHWHVISHLRIIQRRNYVVYRELAGGKGFADMVFVPRKTAQTPAIVVELKWNQTARRQRSTQIKRKQYVRKPWKDSEGRSDTCWDQL